MPPDSWYWLGLGAAAILTSIVSGVMGMAGGMLLMTTMLLRLEPAVVIPVHGVVQLVSNGSRAFFLRDQVRWPVVWRFSWPLLPAGAIGLLFAGYVPVSVSRIAIGCFVLSCIWAPQLISLGRGSPDPRRSLALGGALVGFFSTIVGATGPLLGPFILALELGAQPTIATIAACQIFQHTTKVALFGISGFDLFSYALPCALLCSCAILGSAIGTRLLPSVPEKAFRLLIKLVLTSLAFGQFYQGLTPLRFLAG